MKTSQNATSNVLNKTVIFKKKKKNENDLLILTLKKSNRIHLLTLSES